MSASAFIRALASVEEAAAKSQLQNQQPLHQQPLHHHTPQNAVAEMLSFDAESVKHRCGRVASLIGRGELRMLASRQRAVAELLRGTREGAVAVPSETVAAVKALAVQEQARRFGGGAEVRRHVALAVWGILVLLAANEGLQWVAQRQKMRADAQRGSE